MQVTETKTEGLKREFTILVPAATIEEHVNARLAEVGKNASLPGFRPGKVPMKVIAERYRGAVMGEVLERTVNDATAQAVKERDLRPALQPKVEIISFDEGKDLEFSVAMEVLPEIVVGELGKITLERLKATAPAEDVEKAMENLAGQHAHAHPIHAARPAAKGDVVEIDFVGKLDGVPFEGGSGNGFDLELGSGMFIPGFEEQLIGAEKGAAVEVKVTFPAEYHAKDLAGKETTFDVTVKEIKEVHKHEINDELAKHEGLENVAALREAVKGRIEAEFQQVSRQRLKRALLDALDESHKFEIPPAMLENEFEAIWKTIEEAKTTGTLDAADVAKSEDALKEEYRAIAERRVRLGLLLAEIGRVNNIQVTKEDLQRAMFQQARNFPGQERQVFEYFTKNPEAMEQFHAPLFEEKTVDFILELVKLEDREVTPQELLADPDAAPAEAEADKPKKAAKKKAAKAEEGEPAAEAEADKPKKKKKAAAEE